MSGVAGGSFTKGFYPSLSSVSTFTTSASEQIGLKPAKKRGTAIYSVGMMRSWCLVEWRAVYTRRCLCSARFGLYRWNRFVLKEITAQGKDENIKYRKMK